jgi:cytochrome b6-f complex iron-sulfur subunit
MNRREVIQKFLLGGTVLVLVPSVIESCSKDNSMNPGTTTVTPPPPAGTSINIDLSLAENSALNTKGSSMVVQNVLIINTGTSIVALSAICTHQGCTVDYHPTAGDIECPCHGSVYSISGSVITGPAPSALKSYSVTKTGNVITINT